MSVPQEVILAPQERFLHLSSEYATETIQGPAQCRFRLSAPVSASNEQYCMAVGVHNATIPHTWYNVAGYRFSMYFSNVAGNIVSGSIPVKNYTATSLASALQTAINALLTAATQPATFTVVYDGETNFMSFSYNVVALQSPWYFTSVSDNCYLELGLRALSFGRTSAVISTLNNAGTAFVLAAPAMVDLSRFHGVYINLLSSTSNAQASYSELAMTPILARVPVRNPFGAVETYEPDNMTYLYIPGGALTDVHIALTGDDGRVLDLNGVDWTMTLHVKYMAIRQPESPVERLLPASTMTGVQAVGGRRVY